MVAHATAFVVPLCAMSEIPASPPTSSGPAARAPSRRRLWAVRLAFLGFGFLSLELGLRAFLFVRGDSYSAAETEDHMRSSLSSIFRELPAKDAGPSPRANPIGRVVHPYYGFETFVGQEALDSIYAEHLARSADSRPEVWIVGGSVAAVFADPRHGSAHLADRLVSAGVLDGERPVVRNFARASFKQPQQLMIVNFMLALGLRPDVLINIDGFNEAAIGTRNSRVDAHPAFPSVTQWGNLAIGHTSERELVELRFEMTRAEYSARSIAKRTLDLGLHHSALLGIVSLRRFESALRDRRARVQDIYDRLGRQAGDPVLRGPALTDRERTTDVVLETWIQSSRSLAALAANRDFLYLHVLQPTLHDEGSKPLTERERRDGGRADATWIEGVKNCYPRFKAARTELEQLGIEFHDASLVFADVEEPLYYDLCHFTAPGNKLLADSIADALIERLR